MRVIGGTAKGRAIKVPKRPGVRPALARQREALFAILGGRVLQARVLDLYCGSGSLGIEALSRGASWVSFVDGDGLSLRVVRENLERLGLSERASTHRRRLPAGLEGRLGEPYELVFTDPPFAEDPLDDLSKRLISGLLVVDEPLWIHRLSVKSAKGRAAHLPEGWCLIDERRYGDSLIWWLERVG